MVDLRNYQEGMKSGSLFAYTSVPHYSGSAPHAQLNFLPAKYQSINVNGYNKEVSKMQEKHSKKCEQNSSKWPV